MYLFQCDYTDGCHPEILDLLNKTNNECLPGYCEDSICEEAQGLVLKACGLTDKKAQVHWVLSGTMANLSVLSTVLQSNESVIAANSAHIATAEAGAIEATGSKIITVEGIGGKLKASQIEKVCMDYERLDPIDQSHLTRPAAVYITFPTELGTLYSLKELEDIAAVCSKHGLFLYLDGARLAYGLNGSDVKLADIARLTDAFYIGGTKCGALAGDAVVMKRSNISRRYLGVLRMRGGLIAKGRLVGCAFKAFFRDGLYERIGLQAAEKAQRLRLAFEKKGIEMFSDSPTNQIFPIVDEKLYSELKKEFRFKLFQRKGNEQFILRFCTSWSTSEESIEALEKFLRLYENGN